MNTADVFRIVNSINQNSEIRLIENVDNGENCLFTFKRGKMRFIGNAVPTKDKSGNEIVKKIHFSLLVKKSPSIAIDNILPMVNKLNIEDESGCVYAYDDDTKHYLIRTESRILSDNSYSKNLKMSDNGLVIGSSLFLAWEILILESLLSLMKASVVLFEEQKKHNEDNVTKLDDEE